MDSLIWKTVKIKDIAKINPDSISPKTPQDTLINYIDLESVKKGKILAIKEMQLSDAPSRAKRVVKSGDVLFSTVRPYQKNFTIIENEQDNLIASTGFAILRAKENSDSRFLYQMLYSDVVMNQIISEMKGSNYPAVNASDVENVEILLPSLEEQQKIASILSTVDEQIDETEQLIVKTKELKKGLMQQLLTKGIGHTEFKQTELGEIPENWGITSIEEISTVIRGASPRPKGDPRYYGGKVPRLMVADVTRDKKYVTPKIDFLTEAGALKSRPMKKGDFVVVCSGTVGLPAILAVDACIHDGFLALKDIDDKCSKEFLYYQFSSLREELDAAATHGGVFTNLTTQIVKEFKITLPSIEEQQKIAAILSTVDEQIEVYEQEKAKYEELKKGLMQQLLTGQIRVKI